MDTHGGFPARYPRIFQRLFSLAAALACLLTLTVNTTSAAELSLTEEERAWLSAHPEIKLAVDINWAPFEFVNEANEYTGMAAEFVELVSRRLGITFDIDKVRSWPEMVEAVKNRDLDAFSLVVQTPQRDEYVNFTDPYISFPMVIVTLDDAPYIDGLSVLAGRKIAVVKGYASNELLADNHPELDLLTTDSVLAGLEAVSHGGAYAFVGNLAVTNQVMREAGITNLKISGQTPYRFELRMAVRNDWPELVPILQKALDSITVEERQQIFDRWIHIKFTSEVDRSTVLTILFVALAVIAFVLVWNRKLGKEVRLRKQSEEQLAHARTRLDEIIEGTNVGTWEWNVQTGETVFSERWANIFGYSLSELAPVSGDTWKQHCHADDLERIYEELYKAFRGEVDYYVNDFRMNHKNGGVVWVHERGKVVEWDKDGQPLRMSGTHSDITRQKNAEISLRESREELGRHVAELDASRARLDEIIWSTDVGTWEWNIQTDEAVFSERWANIFGYTLDEISPVSGETWKQYAHADDMEHIYGKLDRVFRGEVDYYVNDFRMNHKNGGVVWVRSRGKVVEWDKDGQPLRMSGTQSDITRQKNDEIEVASLNDRLRYEIDVKNRFFSIISHDLRSPFTILLGMTETMKKMAGTLTREKLAEYAADVNTVGERVYELLQVLLEWSRLQMDGAELERTTLSLHDLAQECVDLSSPAASKKDITLTNAIGKDTAFADRHMVQTVLRNLIANAVKFTNAGGTIDVSARTDGNTVHVTVSDTGVGMQQDLMDNIFSLDQKTSTTGTAGESGTGLGLPLCKDMLERNDGTIWVESTIGEGSQFHFTLPVSAS